ncbi:MAG: 5'-methylthioadenosine/S-adenosylhomocysteine nucleosidase [Ignavibacterium sp.]|nr:5'-methylthioadenosine/S-adenosylhomocysteine nucleosidase [Ignavibacterium sp.]
MNTIVIQTALALEQQAVTNKLSNVNDYEHPASKTIYKVGHYFSKGNKLQIIVGRTNQTNINAAIETERVIQHFNPTYIFFLGVAGSLKDVKIGDVVIGTDVIGYERGKAKEEFLLRPQFGFSSYELEQKAISFINSDEWQMQSSILLNKQFHYKIAALTGTIASGEKVIGSTASSIYLFLKKHCSHALAVEMEGLGFLEACRPYPLIKSLIIRGISDIVNGKEHSDAQGSQEYASNNATEFLFGLIDFIGIKQEIVTLSLRQKLYEILPKFYPSGLRDNEIWRRAGGDLSLVNLNTTGKAQWVDALMLIENGGGGYITFNSLITQMRIDYPNNESLKILCIECK